MPNDSEALPYGVHPLDGSKGHVHDPSRCNHAPDDGCEWCCAICNYDRHRCPGCGTVTDHRESVCGDCTTQVRPRD